jgi:YihY family inner membrane protein
MRRWLVRLYRDAALGHLASGRPATQARLVEAVHALVVLGRESVRDRLHVRAAMLAYWSSVAVVPTLLLAFALSGPLGLVDDSRDAVLAFLYDTVLASSVSEVGRALDATLAQVNVKALGVVGVVGIMGIGAQLFFNVELAYNDIFHVRVRRSRLLRITLFYAALTLAPVGLAWGFVMTARVPQASSLLATLAPIGLTAAVLVAGIRLLPCVAVSWRAALAGGITSALLFEGAKQGFGVYTGMLGASDNLARIYGSLAFLPIFLLWLYVLWIIILFGVKLAFLVEHYRPLVDEQRRQVLDVHAPHRRPDSAFGLQVMLVVAARYLDGEGGSCTEDVADRLGTSLLHVQTAMDVLEDAGLLVETTDGRFLPTVPPSRQTGAEVVQAWRRLAAPVLEAEGVGQAAVLGAQEAMARVLARPLSAMVEEEAGPEAEGGGARAPAVAVPS